MMLNVKAFVLIVLVILFYIQGYLFMSGASVWKLQKIKGFVLKNTVDTDICSFHEGRIFTRRYYNNNIADIIKKCFFFIEF